VILQDVIQPLVTKVKQPYGYGQRTVDGLTDAAKINILAQVEGFFKTHGWKVKKLKASYVARKPKHHTKINFSIHYPYSKVELFAKTPNGGWSSIASSFYGSEDFTAYIKEAEKIPAPAMISKDSLPEAWEFGGDALATNSNGWIYFNHEIQQCRVVSVVALKKDGSITKAAADVAKPNEQVWFHLDCQNALGATFDIITDGEIFYPIKRYGKQRITTNPNPKASVDLKSVTQMDKQLINLAIEAYFNK
jgi:hypothetical protein